MTDHDECMRGYNGCSKHAYCTNTVGSYVCTCEDGYQGNGMGCKGRQGTAFPGTKFIPRFLLAAPRIFAKVVARTFLGLNLRCYVQNTMICQ